MNINIKTKKNKTMGFNGTYNGSMGKGEYYRNNNSLNLNYRKNKLNVFTNLGYSNWKGFNDLNRLLAKLCAMCGNPKNGKIPNATTEFNENDEDVQSYFDFDDVEGVDLDDEKDRLDKVLKFRDCNNFKIPINATKNKSHCIDFIFYFKKRNAKIAAKIGEVYLNGIVKNKVQIGLKKTI